MYPTWRASGFLVPKQIRQNMRVPRQQQQQGHQHGETFTSEGIRARYGLAHTANSTLSTIDFNLEDITQWEILYAGATYHFLCTDAGVTGVKLTTDPIIARIPDRLQLTSTNTRELNLPHLPHTARTGRILPGMSSWSLIYVITLYNADCWVTFDKMGVIVTHRGQTTIEGNTFTRTRL